MRPARNRFTPDALGALCLAAAGLSCPSAAQAREGLDLAISYVADTAVTASGGADDRFRFLDNLELTADADLQALWQIDGTTIHAGLLRNAGAKANDSAASLEGVSNIEVARGAIRLFEAWAEKRLGQSSLRLGLYDLNSEFNATESAALLIAPPFGIGSELAATGSNGPSVFPSSALAIRLKAPLPAPGGYVQFAMVNARAQTLGDPGGIDLSFREGLLLVAEAGGGDRLRGGIGLWSYTRGSEALASLDPDGNPIRDRSRGVYAMTEYNWARGGARSVTSFLRGGIARGKGSPFASSVQAGVLIIPAIIGRNASALSIGYHQAATSAEFRSAQRDAGEPVWRRERAIEATFSDSVTPFLTLQPDVQWIARSDENGATQGAVQMTLRVTLSF